MIQETLTLKGKAAITSDLWHVVHAHWTGKSTETPRFVRTIVSEHESREQAVRAARGLESTLNGELPDRPLDRRDHVFVRKPSFKSLKTARRRERPGG